MAAVCGEKTFLGMTAGVLKLNRCGAVEADSWNVPRKILVVFCTGRFSQRAALQCFECGFAVGPGQDRSCCAVGGGEGVGGYRSYGDLMLVKLETINVMCVAFKNAVFVSCLFLRAKKKFVMWVIMMVKTFFFKG